jgi:hypothetical protein
MDRRISVNSQEFLDSLPMQNNEDKVKVSYNSTPKGIKSVTVDYTRTLSQNFNSVKYGLIVESDLAKTENIDDKVRELTEYVVNNVDGIIDTLRGNKIL